MPSEVWRPLPTVNYVFDALRRLTRDGDRPTRLLDLMAEVERTAGSKVSYTDLVRALARLEILGYVRVTASTSLDEYIVELRKARAGQA